MANPKKVVIVGGSLAGLLSALVLKRLGHDVHILERNPTKLLHNQGAGIVFGKYSQEFFRKFVRNSKEEGWTVKSVLRQTLDRKGKSIAEMEERYGQEMISWDLVYAVLRAEGDGVESGYVGVEVPGKKKGEGAVRYQYGCLATGVREKGDRVKVEFKDRDGEVKTVEADLILAADGSSSSLRKILLPDVKRTYAGYVAWRGTVLESEATESMKDTFVDHFTFFHNHERGIQILVYLIPGEKGTTKPGSRLINWVWYCNYPQDSPEYKDLMTDSEGKVHHYTLPVGKIKDEVWTRQKQYAESVLPPQFSDLVKATKQPFFQAITDVLSTQASFMDGKVLLVGDALAGFRPHTAASTSQAAYHAILLDRYMRMEIDMSEMEALMMDHVRHMCEAGIRMGNNSQFNKGSERLNMQELART